MRFIKKISLTLLFLISYNLIWGVDYETIQVKSNYTSGWGTQRTKTVALLPGFVNGTDGGDDFTRYNTYKYLRTDSTGFFYVKKIDGRWWMIDPDGYAGINMAATSFTSDNIQDDYDVIKKNGFNGTGNFLSSESQTKSGYNFQNYATFSFTRRINFFLSYKNVRKNYYTTPSTIQGSLNHIFVLDPQFEVYCDNLARTNVTPFANERDLLGYFTDNEINFNQDQLRNLVRDLPAGDPSRDSALVFATARGLSETDCINYTTKVTEAIKQEFATYLAERYYKIVSEAIRKYDSNHLILGSRLHGRPRAINGVVKASHKYMDVTSVNFYDRFTPNEQIANSAWTDDKPCIVGEFYIKDINAYNVSQSGAGWYVNSQASRGKFYQNTCLELLKNKCYIGWHYFRYMDDVNSNKGIVNPSRQEYTEMTYYMNELNKQVYRICDYYDSINRRPVFSTLSETVSCTSDTYLEAGATNGNIFGSASELEIRHNQMEENRREAFLKFDLSEFKELLPYVKHAELEFTCVATDNIPHSIFISGIEDDSWSEQTLTGALQSTNADWKNGYNRISFIKSVIEPKTYSVDVTPWVADRMNNTISFKIHELSFSDVGIKIASKEHSDNNLIPKLKITFWDKNMSGVSLQKKNSIRIFPNPAVSLLNIEGDNVNLVEILSITGKRISVSNKNQIDVSKLASGMFLIKLTFENGDTLIERFIKK